MHFDGIAHGWGMWIFWCVLFIGFLWLVLSKNRSSRGDSPLDVLNKRYAKGEIDKKEYDRIRETINGN
jgi:putative membrane protein